MRGIERAAETPIPEGRKRALLGFRRGEGGGVAGPRSRFCISSACLRFWGVRGGLGLDGLAGGCYGGVVVLDGNEEYIEVRVPVADWPWVSERLGKTFAYRRLSSRDGAWGLVWDLTVGLELEAVVLERDALVAALRHATRLLPASGAELVRSTYRSRLEA